VSLRLTERTPRRARARRAAMVAIGVVSLLVLTGCTQAEKDQWKRLGLPPAASNRSPYMEDLWIGSWIAAGIVGVFVWGLIGWAVVRYRRRSNDELPVQVRYNLPIEVLYTVAPVIIVAVLFFFTVEKQNKILADVNNPDHNVTVTAQQWSWTFNYVDEPSIGGQTVYDAGNAVTLPQLWLVKGQSVTFTLHSPDVIDDFWVPAFYFKQDVIPGRDAAFSMTPTSYGTFAGRCAELCGTQHSRMLFTVRVVTQSAFDAHLQELLANGQTGLLLGGSNSDTVAGLDTNVGGTS
jgi:cytochrome c oxidase subunit II